MLNEKTVEAQGTKPNLPGIFGDDIGEMNINAYSMEVMGYRTPNIDRVAKEGTRISTLSVLQKDAHPSLL